MPNHPLNPALFEQLQHRFGMVKVIKGGEPRRAEYTPNRFALGGYLSRARSYGEQYQFSCPFCGDRRGRAYISYMYGQIDPVTKSKNLNLWCCYNEQCHRIAGHSERLQACLAIPVGRRAVLPAVSCISPASSNTTPTEAVAAPLPLCVLIDALPNSHAAVAYLNSRGFDPRVLVHYWGIAFCELSPFNHYTANGRIIIPVWSYAQNFARGGSPPSFVVAGWQSRTISDGNGQQKYLNASGMKKSELLYGLPLATNTSGPVWICEGVTDCWKVGPGAVALFGKSLSQQQKLLIVHHFAGRPIVVLLDRDARNEANEICQQLQRARGLSEGDRRVIVLDVPAGRNDPGECTQAEIFEATAHALGTPIVRDLVATDRSTSTSEQPTL